MPGSHYVTWIVGLPTMVFIAPLACCGNIDCLREQYSYSQPAPLDFNYLATPPHRLWPDDNITMTKASYALKYNKCSDKELRRFIADRGLNAS